GGDRLSRSSALVVLRRADSVAPSVAAHSESENGRKGQNGINMAKNTDHNSPPEDQKIAAFGSSYIECISLQELPRAAIF
uniref:hypothetical protein n=1 Tax=Pseudomonas viridiflava TaxID=33069 RepID=UPI0019819D7A